MCLDIYRDGSSWCSWQVAASKWQLKALENYAAWLIMAPCLVLWSILPNTFRPTVDLSKFRGSKWHPKKFQMVSWCEWIFLLISIVRSNPAELFSFSIFLWIGPRGHGVMEWSARPGFDPSRRRIQMNFSPLGYKVVERAQSRWIAWFIGFKL